MNVKDTETLGRIVPSYTAPPGVVGRTPDDNEYMPAAFLCCLRPDADIEHTHTSCPLELPSSQSPRLAHRNIPSTSRSNNHPRQPTAGQERDISGITSCPTRTEARVAALQLLSALHGGGRVYHRTIGFTRTGDAGPVSRDPVCSPAHVCALSKSP